VVVAKARQAGNNVIIDGNHTVAGILKSKHGRDVIVAVIPEDVHNEYTNEELIAVGNLLNRPSDVVKQRASKLDMIKYIQTQHLKGVPVNDSSNKEFLKEMKFTNKQIKSILLEAQKEIDKDDLKKANQLWIDYSTGSG